MANKTDMSNFKFPPPQNVKFVTSPKFNIPILIFCLSKIENLPYAKMQSQIQDIQQHFS
jgi:hypothetical protein